MLLVNLVMQYTVTGQLQNTAKTILISYCILYLFKYYNKVSFFSTVCLLDFKCSGKHVHAMRTKLSLQHYVCNMD